MQQYTDFGEISFPSNAPDNCGQVQKEQNKRSLQEVTDGIIVPANQKILGFQPCKSRLHYPTGGQIVNAAFECGTVKATKHTLQVTYWGPGLRES